MSKFHVSTETGRAGKCTADKKPCPFGGETGREEHFATKEEAKSNQDRIMQAHYGNKNGTMTRGQAYDPVKTPVETDAQLSEKYSELSKLEQQVSYKLSSLRSEVGDHGKRIKIGRSFQTVYEHDAASAIEIIAERASVLETEKAKLLENENHDKSEINYINYKINKLNEKIDEYYQAENNTEDKQAEIQKLNKVFNKHQWSRFFIVPDGHIHESMECSTCNNGKNATQFGWLPELSGKNEKDAVSEHGARLCTVCYPSAPTEWTNYKEVEEAKKLAESCDGSGTYDWVEGTTRFGYVSGNGGKCSHCNERVGATPNQAIRKHKSK